MLNTIQDAVKLLLPAKHKTNATSGWTSFNAPCCHHNGESADTRGRGGLVSNSDGGVSYHCFNCNFKASYIPGRHLTYNFRKLLSWLGASESEVKRLVIDAIRVKDLISPEKIQQVQETEIVFSPRPVPSNARLLREHAEQRLLDYLNARKIDTDRYDFYHTDEQAYNLHRRVIIPFTWRNNIIGYTARAIEDGIKPKYFSQYEPNYVFNVDRQLPDSKFVIVCEGPFDAMSIDGVAILSNECSEIQADIIDSLGREVIVVPDADRAGIKLIDTALKFGWNVSYPIWFEKYKDVNEAVANLGRLFVLKSIIDAKESGRLKIELKRKKLHN
jgi:hypothetical protein